MNLNSSSCHFSLGQIDGDHDQERHHPKFAANHSQPCVSFRIFFNSNQDHLGCYDRHLSHHQLDEIRTYNQGGSSAPGIKSDVESGLKLTLWKNEDYIHGDHDMRGQTIDKNPKWVSSKTKNLENHTRLKITNSPIVELGDQKFQPATDHTGSTNSSYNNSPIRVCSDCNTTKTPLWRSGPNGPKSLCNACGIRQRKARRALAAAEAATAQPSAMKIKAQHKENMSKIKGQIKKRRKTEVSPASSDRSPPNNGQEKLCFEDFLINLSKKLSFQRKFPEDEKDAAILLMAISSGLVHG